MRKWIALAAGAMAIGLAGAVQASTEGCYQEGWSNTENFTAEATGGGVGMFSFNVSIPAPGGSPPSDCDEYHISDLTSLSVTVNGRVASDGSVTPLTDTFAFWDTLTLNGVKKSGSGGNTATFTVVFPAHPDDEAFDFSAANEFSAFVTQGTGAFTGSTYSFNSTASGTHYYIPLPASAALLAPVLAGLFAFGRRRRTA